MWKGGRIISNGYVLIHQPNHPKANLHGYVFEHTLVCEQALGKLLPINAIPHHVNEKKDDNRTGNLVLCQNKAYHNLLHRRMRALRACGNPNWHKCGYCKKYDDPKNLRLQPKYSAGHHVECSVLYLKKRREAKKNKGDSCNG